MTPAQNAGRSSAFRVGATAVKTSVLKGVNIKKKGNPLRLFEAIGLELEYMIVDRDSLDVSPVADALLHKVAGSYVDEVHRGDISWSNELSLHVLELKTNGPVRTLERVHLRFQEQVREINRRLETWNAMLLPTSMHPWMDPFTEMKLWPHQNNPIYEAYDRIFDCRGHGWANLQSVHINLPFCGDEEFEKLHAAVRILIPILPGLAASSPIADGEIQCIADYRMEVYRTNARRIPSVTGCIIPEAVFSRESYRREIFEPMFRDIAPFDPEEILRYEWLNSRGAIARFDRGSIEIRVLDIQECPLADLAVTRMVVDLLKALVDERFGPRQEQKYWNENVLYEILLDVMKHGEKAELQGDYLRLFGWPDRDSLSAGGLWNHLFETLYRPEDRATDPVLKVLQRILKTGTLSTRILHHLPDPFTREDLTAVYLELSIALEQGKLFGTE